MSEQVSMVEAHNKFRDLVHKAEEGEVVELIQDGERVAVVVGWQEYERLAGPQPPLPPHPPRKSFIERLEEWRKTFDWSEMGDPAQVWADVRDPDPGRNVDL